MSCSLIIFYIEIFIMFSVYICDSCRFSLLSFILAFLPLLFLSQSLVFVAIVFIVFIILLLFCQYSASYFIVFSVSFVSCSWCYWVFFFVCNYAIIATDCWSVPWTCLWSVVSVSVSVSVSCSSRYMIILPLKINTMLNTLYIYTKSYFNKLNENFIIVKMWKSISNWTMKYVIKVWEYIYKVMLIRLFLPLGVGFRYFFSMSHQKV